MKKTTLIVVFSFFSLFSIGTLAMVNYKPELKKQLKESYSSLLEFNKEPVIPEPTEPLPEETFAVTDLKVFKGRLSKDAYEDHLQAAELKGIGLIEDEKRLFQLVEKAELVEASSGVGYQVDDLTHSHPYITKASKKVLEELGKTFQALAGEENFFTVTSVTRTEEQQKKLSRRNRNATAGESSHSFGVSFDISYIRFNGIKGYDQKAIKQLETVLNHFQQTGKIYVIKERKQSCYHITVR
jgi:hypothetical protein